MGTQLPSPKRGQSPQFSAHFYCGQTAGCIKMPLGMEVGLSPGDFVLDGDPDSLPKNGRSPQIFGPRLLWPNGYMDQDATWYGGRPRLRRHCVRWGPSSSSPRGAHPAPHFSANVRCGQTAKMALGIEVGLGLQATLCSIGTQLPPEKRTHPPPNFWPMSIVPKRLHG